MFVQPWFQLPHQPFQGPQAPHQPFHGPHPAGADDDDDDDDELVDWAAAGVARPAAASRAAASRARKAGRLVDEVRFIVCAACVSVVGAGRAGGGGRVV